MSRLLVRNQQFAEDYAPIPLGIPATRLLIVTCLDHRVDPAVTLGLKLGDAPVIRNAGGRVTQSAIDDIAYLGFLAGQLFASQDKKPELFEVAVIHHTQCGTGFLADPGFLRQAAAETGLSEADLAASAVPDPHVTVREDVRRLLAAPLFPSRASVSGHVYEVETGRIVTVIGASYPDPAPAG